MEYARPGNAERATARGQPRRRLGVAPLLKKGGAWQERKRRWEERPRAVSAGTAIRGSTNCRPARAGAGEQTIAPERSETTAGSAGALRRIGCDGLVATDW